MLLITCPWCGPREQSEFAYGGEAGIARPEDTDALTDEQWGDYVFFRKNPRGRHLEQWVHAFGCRRWFNVERDTVTYRIAASYKPGEPAPEGAGSPGFAALNPGYSPSPTSDAAPDVARVERSETRGDSPSPTSDAASDVARVERSETRGGNPSTASDVARVERSETRGDGDPTP